MSCGEIWIYFLTRLGRTIPVLTTMGLTGSSESEIECNGNINDVDTTGASSTTARPEGLNYSGVRASEEIARKDLDRMKGYKPMIISAARKHNMDPAVIAGIISRESHAGHVLENGWGDHGNAFGLMQVDKRYHTPVGSWNSQEHLDQGTGILADMINTIEDKFPEWTTEQQLKGGISAYNTGPGNVHNYPGVDNGTTHQDYANDVVARAKFYKRNGY